MHIIFPVLLKLSTRERTKNANLFQHILIKQIALPNSFFQNIYAIHIGKYRNIVPNPTPANLCQIIRSGIHPAIQQILK